MREEIIKELGLDIKDFWYLARFYYPDMEVESISIEELGCEEINNILKAIEEDKKNGKLKEEIALGISHNVALKNVENLEKILKYIKDKKCGLKEVAKKSEEAGFNAVWNIYKRFDNAVDKVLREFTGEKKEEQFGLKDLYKKVKGWFKKDEKNNN